MGRATGCLFALLLAGCGAGRAPSMAPAESRPDARPEVRPEEPGPFAALTVVQAGPLAGMHFHHYGVNPTVDTAEEQSSTFGLNADTAAWEVARSHLVRGTLPPPASVRVEDFVNAFRGGDQAPPADTFSLQIEAFPSPNRPGYHVVRLDLRAGEAPPRPVRVVAVVDVAGRDAQRLDLAREALRQVFARLGPGDEVAVVAADGRLLLGPRAPDDPAVRPGLVALEASSALASGGLAAAYALAAESPAGHGRQVIYCGDGRVDREARVFDGLVEAARRGQALGIGLTAVGVGLGQYDDARMALLAQAGGGRYLYVDQAATAQRSFSERLPAARPVVARAAQAEVVFDPAAVVRYRLLGHERHAERPADGLAVAGGDVPAGQGLSVLYEAKLVPGNGRDLGVLRVRYRRVGGGEAALFEAPLARAGVRDAYAQASGEGRLALVAAAFGEKLRGAWWVRGVDHAALLSQWDALPAELRQRPDVAELRRLIAQAGALEARKTPAAGRAPVAGMDFDHVPILSE
ncbi:MAG: von Willebrand factor type A domain-containing protein [bacterium]